ncbi:hypothetical protein H4R21_004123, partial [Coemansia helicoidea]
MGRPSTSADMREARFGRLGTSARSPDGSAEGDRLEFGEVSSSEVSDATAKSPPALAPPRVSVPPKKKTPRATRQIVESSDEAPASPPAAKGSAASGSGGDSVPPTPANAAHGPTRATSAVPKRTVASSARPPQRTATATPKGKGPAQSPNSAPAGQVKQVAKRIPGRRLIRTPGLPKTTEKTAPKPPSASSDEHSAAIKETPAGVESTAIGDADDNTMVTPTKKAKRPHFRYTEPKATTSITRSGRKVQPPKEWWANAQERLDSPHTEPTIKYRWGKIDAMVVRDGKRVRLSDVFLEDGDADPL